MALIDPLLKTTRSPIWVHPLLWRLDHLDKFGISIHLIDDPHCVDPPSQKQTGLPSSPSDVGRRLTGGSIGSRDLRYVLQDIRLLGTYLAGFIMRTINTFQKPLRPKQFRYYYQEQRPKPPSPLFTFDNIVIQIHPELVVRTKKGIPFLMYNCAERTSALRRDFPSTRAGSGIELSLKRSVRRLDFKFELIDPYDVAGLIALAQEQLSVFSRLSQTVPEVFKAYFISPHTSQAAVFLYTANIPLRYLAALHNPYLSIETAVIITRELIYLPTPPATGGKDISEGPFLRKLAQILEEALGYERFFPKSPLLPRARGHVVSPSSSKENSRS